MIEARKEDRVGPRQRESCVATRLECRRTPVWPGNRSKLSRVELDPARLRLPDVLDMIQMNL